MRLLLLTALTMVAFAANSVLNRMAIFGQGMDPLDFAAIRLGAGAGVLWALVWLSGGRLVLSGPLRWRGAASLLVYMIGFSLAYLALGAGLGALILFASVQITMFAGALLAGERVPSAPLAGCGHRDGRVGVALVAATGAADFYRPGSIDGAGRCRLGDLFADRAARS